MEVTYSEFVIQTDSVKILNFSRLSNSHEVQYAMCVPRLVEIPYYETFFQY